MAIKGQHLIIVVFFITVNSVERPIADAIIVVMLALHKFVHCITPRRRSVWNNVANGKCELPRTRETDQRPVQSTILPWRRRNLYRHQSSSVGGRTTAAAETPPLRGRRSRDGWGVCESLVQSTLRAVDRNVCLQSFGPLPKSRRPSWQWLHSHVGQENSRKKGKIYRKWMIQLINWLFN